MNDLPGGEDASTVTLSAEWLVERDRGEGEALQPYPPACKCEARLSGALMAKHGCHTAVERATDAVARINAVPCPAQCVNLQQRVTSHGRQPRIQQHTIRCRGVGWQATWMSIAAYDAIAESTWHNEVRLGDPQRSDHEMCHVPERLLIWQQHSWDELESSCHALRIAHMLTFTLKFAKLGLLTHTGSPSCMLSAGDGTLLTLLAMSNGACWMYRSKRRNVTRSPRRVLPASTTCGCTDRPLPPSVSSGFRKFTKLLVERRRVSPGALSSFALSAAWPRSPED